VIHSALGSTRENFTEVLGTLANGANIMDGVSINNHDKNIKANLDSSVEDERVSNDRSQESKENHWIKSRSLE